MAFEQHNQSSVSTHNGFLPDRQLLSNVGIALLWTTFATGHFIFGLGDGDHRDAGEEPYRSKVR